MDEFVAYALIAWLIFCVCGPLGIALVVAGYVRDRIWLKVSGFSLIFVGVGAFTLFEYIY